MLIFYNNFSETLGVMENFKCDSLDISLQLLQLLGHNAICVRSRISSSCQRNNEFTNKVNLVNKLLQALTIFA